MGHGNTGDQCSGAGRRWIVLATNRNGGMLRLNASRHDDDDDDDDDGHQGGHPARKQYHSSKEKPWQAK